MSGSAEQPFREIPADGPERLERLRVQRRDPVTKKFLPLADGEVGANYRTGLYARRLNLAPEAEADQAYAEAWTAQYLTDQGQAPEDLAPAMRKELTAAAGDLVYAKRRLIADLRQRGFITKKGTVRSSFSVLLSVIDRLEKLSRTLGLDRQPKDANQTLADWLNAAEPNDDPHPVIGDRARTQEQTDDEGAHHEP